MIRAGFLLGVDTSDKSLELANRNYGGERSSFRPIAEYEPREEWTWFTAMESSTTFRW